MGRTVMLFIAILIFSEATHNLGSLEPYSLFQKLVRSVMVRMLELITLDRNTFVFAFVSASRLPSIGDIVSI